MNCAQEVGLISKEFRGCEFKDKRLSKRILRISESLFSRPGSIIWSTFKTIAECKAAYNFFRNPKVTVSGIQSPHFSKTIEDIAKRQEDILLIQDTVYCTLPNGKAFEDSPGYLYKNKKSENTQGFAVHSSLALTSMGIPIGLASQNFYQHYEKEEKHRNLPIEEKESYRWLSGMRILDNDIAQQDNIIHLCDREGDVFEVLSCTYQENRRFIIRQSYDRITGKKSTESEGYILDRLSHLDWKYEHELEIYDSESSKYIKRKIGIKSIEMQLPVPKGKKFDQEIALKEPTTVNIVEVSSIDDLAEIRWILFTNLEILNKEDILKVINYYKLRWHIENYHKVLKSGFKVEDARLEKYESLRNLLSLLSILSIKLYYLIHLSRVDGEKSCEEVLERHEWETLCIHNGLVKFENREQAKAPILKEAVIMIAQLGGYMNRKKDAPPGIIVIWRGWSRLAEMASYHQIVTNARKTYG